MPWIIDKGKKRLPNFVANRLWNDILNHILIVSHLAAYGWGYFGTYARHEISTGQFQ